MRSSRSFKRGNKSSSPGREMKDKTKRIKCFGCEHISFHFLLLVANNSPMFGGGGMSRQTFTQKYRSGAFRAPGQSKGTPSTVLEHLSNFLFPPRCWLGKMSCRQEPARSQVGASGEGNFTTRSLNASGPSQRHILFAGAEDENLSHSH